VTPESSPGANDQRLQHRAVRRDRAHEPLHAEADLARADRGGEGAGAELPSTGAR
jgi:hypothetical protein